MNNKKKRRRPDFQGGIYSPFNRIFPKDSFWTGDHSVSVAFLLAIYPHKKL